MTPVRARTLLGLTAAEATDADKIRAARRLRAKRLHPDAGGNDAQMAALNRAADELLAALPNDPSPEPFGAADAGPVTPTVVSTRRPGPGPGRMAHDTASFVIEALPVVAFEVLTVAAAELGEVADDDPPYQLDVVLGAPLSCWCRLDVVPDAGASTVSITLVAVPGELLPDVDDVRDLWVAAINQLVIEDPAEWP